MTVSEYIFQFLSKKGIKTVFMVSGSSAMFLTDALKRNEDLKVICNHHEQATAMSADLYGRINIVPGVALVTIGPGATNAITGVAQAYTDSSPLIVISGQANSRLLKYEQDTGIRQHGTQSLNLEPLVSSITKYFAAVMKAEDIRYHMERAFFEAMDGRKGPVWIDVPIDIQNKPIPADMRSYEPEQAIYDELDLEKIREWLAVSKKPLIFAGGGALDSDIDGLSRALSIPVVTSRMGIGVMPSDNPLFVGRPGSYGDRASHFAIQQCDLLFVLGCRLSVSTIGYYPDRLAPLAKKIQVDLDKKELAKTDVPVDYKIYNTVNAFIDALISLPPAKSDEWVNHCADLRRKYPVVLEEYKGHRPLNAYYFTQQLSRLAPADSIITVDTGSVCNIVSQTWELKKGQKYLISGGLSCMGFWAGTIGCCKSPSIALSGDGSVSMNVQEFATLKHYNLPIKLFVYKNNGYLLIRHNQHNYMNDRFLGVGPDSGVLIPDYCNIAEAYGLPNVRIECEDDMCSKISQVLAMDGPVVCEVILEEFGEIAPRIASRVMPDGSLKAAEFDDLFPFLNADKD
jgi:acetolactate synthase-1/2/3 large subunit